MCSVGSLLNPSFDCHLCWSWTETWFLLKKAGNSLPKQNTHKCQSCPTLWMFCILCLVESLLSPNLGCQAFYLSNCNLTFAPNAGKLCAKAKNTKVTKLSYSLYILRFAFSWHVKSKFGSSLFFSFGLEFDFWSKCWNLFTEAKLTKVQKLAFSLDVSCFVFSWELVDSKFKRFRCQWTFMWLKLILNILVKNRVVLMFFKTCKSANSFWCPGFSCLVSTQLQKKRAAFTLVKGF